MTKVRSVRKSEVKTRILGSSSQVFPENAKFTTLVKDNFGGQG